MTELAEGEEQDAEDTWRPWRRPEDPGLTAAQHAERPEAGRRSCLAAHCRRLGCRDVSHEGHVHLRPPTVLSPGTWCNAKTSPFPAVGPYSSRVWRIWPIRQTSMALHGSGVGDGCLGSGRYVLSLQAANRSNQHRSSACRSALPRAMSAQGLDSLKRRTRARQALTGSCSSSQSSRKPRSYWRHCSTDFATWSSSGFGRRADARSDLSIKSTTTSRLLPIRSLRLPPLLLQRTADLSSRRADEIQVGPMR